MSDWHNIGRISPVPAGVWGETKAYKRLDIVTESGGARTFIALKDVPAGIELSNTEYWQIVVDVAAANIDAVNRLTSPFAKNGSVVACNPVERHPLNVKTIIEPVQAGSGDPSPDNVRPIEGLTSANLARAGKNMMPDFRNTFSGGGITFTKNPDGSWYIKGTATSAVSFGLIEKTNKFCLPTNKYAVSFGTAFPSGVSARAEAYDKITEKWVKTYGNIPAASGHYTIDVSDEYYTTLTVTITSGSAVNITVYPMIRLASVSDSAYEPYHSDTFTAGFGQTVYGGELDWNTGVLTVDKKLITLTGDEKWGVSSSQQNAYYVGSNDNPGMLDYMVTGGSYGYVPHMVSHYKSVPYGTSMVNNTCDTFTGASGYTVRIKDDRFTSTDAWVENVKAQYAAGTPLQVVITIAIPITIQLTPQQILALRGTNTLWSDCGTTDVTGRIDPAWMNEQLKNAIIALGGNV